MMSMEALEKVCELMEPFGNSEGSSVGAVHGVHIAVAMHIVSSVPD